MRPFSLASVLALLATAASGCLDDGGARDDALPGPLPPSDTPASIPWTLTTCRHAVWSAAVPDASVVQSRVPEGFQVQAGPGGTAQLWMEAFECASGSGMDGVDVPALEYGSLFALVDAPDEYGCDRLEGGCYVKIDLLVPDQERREWLVAHGVAAHDGTADVTVDAAGTWTASLVMEGVGGFGMQGVPSGPERAGPGFPFMEFMQATGGVAVWSAETADVSQALGVGVWSADPGTWVQAEVGLLGPTTFSLGTWSFVDGKIVLPSAGSPPA